MPYIINNSVKMLLIYILGKHCTKKLEPNPVKVSFLKISSIFTLLFRAFKIKL